MTDNLLRHEFQAMGTTVELVVWGLDPPGASSLGSRLQVLAARWETIFSRFQPESELSRLNRTSGVPINVSRELFWVISAALEGYIATGGRFDPTIIGSLERAGYDLNFQDIQSGKKSSQREYSDEMEGRFGMLEIELDEVAETIQLPPGVRLDLGGIAKGAFVDSVDNLMCGLPGAILNAGGDLRVWGHPGDSTDWTIGVQHPGSLDEDIAQLRLPAGEPIAVATSSTRSRTWLAQSERQNHLIDPKSLRAVPWSTPSITVIAKTAIAAEVEAKSILIAIARGEPMPHSIADVVLVAHEDGRYETITPYASAA